MTSDLQPAAARNWNLPLSRFPLRGKGRGHTATRSARAGESAGQKQSRLLRLRPVRNQALGLGGYAPLPRLCRPSVEMDFMVNRTTHVLIKPDNLKS